MEVDRYVLNIHKRGYGLYSKIFDDGVENGRFTLTRASVQPVDPRQPIDVTNRRVRSDCPGQLVNAFDWANHKQLLEPRWQDGKNNPMLPPSTAHNNASAATRPFRHFTHAATCWIPQ